jgi:mono/diheme cytochrome c family protein
MRFPIISLTVAAGLLMAASSAQAKTPWVKQAQDLGLKDIQNCQACHTAKLPGLNELGNWLMEEKKKRQATEVDLIWIKEAKRPS